jgi:hypothetical protein
MFYITHLFAGIRQAGSSVFPQVFHRGPWINLDSEIEHAEMALFHVRQEDGIQSAYTNLFQLQQASE